MTAILGLNTYHGDAAAALVIDGELVAAAEEERFTRLKHVAGFPSRASALAERTGEWYEQDQPSPFMIMVDKTRPEQRQRIPAVNHVDDTGRLQTVERAVNTRYYRLIEEFDRLTGVPVVLNTSFNENEPIVMSPEHAVETFQKTRMDLLVLGNHVVRRGDGAA